MSTQPTDQSAADAQPSQTAAPGFAPDIPRSLQTIAGFTWRLLVIAAGLGLIFLIMGRIFSVVFALFFALLITAWTQPLMNLLTRVMPKVVAMILALITIAAAIVAILGVVISSSINEGPKLVASIQQGFSQIQDWLKTGPLQLSDQAFAQVMDQAKGVGTTVAKGFLSDALGALSGIGTLIIAGSVLIFGVIAFLLYPQTVWNWLLSWTPRGVRHHVDVSGRIGWNSIAGYTRGIVVVAFCDATLVFIGLLILQVPLAPALAAVVFIGAFIPVIGAPIATLFAAVVALAERGPLIALLTIGLTVVVGSFDGDVLQPLVMGKAVNLNPLAIVIVIAAGSLTLGIVGALIAVPIAGAVYGVAKYLANRDPDEPFDSPNVPAVRT